MPVDATSLSPPLELSWPGRLSPVLSLFKDSLKSPECCSIFLKTMLIIWIRLAFAVF